PSWPGLSPPSHLGWHSASISGMAGTTPAATTSKPCQELSREEVVNLARGLLVDAGHLGKVRKGCPLDGFQRTEMAKERALAHGTDTRNFLQSRLADVFFAARAVRADGEAVRLVAQPLDEVE